MNTNLLKYLIKAKINDISDADLEKVSQYLATLEVENEPEKIIRMKGIWANLGFDSLVNVEKDVRTLRKGSDRKLLEKQKSWNMQ